MSYYFDKLESLRDIFGTRDVEIFDDRIRIKSRTYPVLDDVIVLLEDRYQPPAVRERIKHIDTNEKSDADRLFSDAVQLSFGRQWQSFAEIMPEHRAEFDNYFDLVDLDSLSGKRCADLGCGIGRWSYFLAPYCREIVLLDFSNAIFVARDRLRERPNAIFFMGDLSALPFRRNFADLIFSLGVLHHLERNCLDLVRSLAPFGRAFLIYLYYALDNRPWYFRPFYKVMDISRRLLSGLRNEGLRQGISVGLVVFAYWPFIAVGHIAALFGLGRYVPLFEYYHDKSFRRIRQDAYDRFFTAIEQRVSRDDINGLKDTFSKIVVSELPPFWHFIAMS